MKRSQIDKLFAEEANRKKTILVYLGMIVLFIGFSFLFLYTYKSLNKTKYINYTENSNVDYKVYLKDNAFYDKNYLDKDNQYISELIDYITAVFDYKLTLERNEVSYKYAYHIDANVSVKDKSTNKNLYTYKETLIQKVEKASTNQTTEIHENVNINYNKYNDLINDFIHTYEIENVSSTLSINMIVDIYNNCNEIDGTGNESKTSIVIPLTNKTVGMDVTNSIIDNEGNAILCTEPPKANVLFLMCSIASILVASFMVIKTIIYMESTKTARTIYEKDLKKILSNYRSYIQKVNGTFDISGYKSLRIDTFEDMLEIRDTINEPILMIENARKTGVYFIIPSANKILYTYSIKVAEIEKEMKKKK